MWSHRRQRAATVLVVVLLVALAASLIVIGLMRRSAQSVRVGTWGRDHLLVRLLAESAAEELLAEVLERANQPGDAVFQLLRTTPFSQGATSVAVPGLQPTQLAAELPALARATGTAIQLVPPAAGRGLVELSQVTPLTPGPGDPMERAGLLQIDVAVRMTGRAIQVTERVRTFRTFSVARSGLPPFPGADFSLLIGVSERESLTNFCPPGKPTGPPVIVTGGGCTRQDSSFRTFRSTLINRPPDGLGAVPAAAIPALAASMRELGPDMLAQRAQIRTSSAAQLYRYLTSRQRQAPGRIDGVLFNASPDLVRLQFVNPPFAGNA